ncbi:MAG TPA: DNA-formamidopyrimidine glycosylase family protein, partial [Candidatus Saccharimonadales bacterium]|nr:DNA-formamidopyrimidine glycosylase family protein [Candidatus Saccharimonadales bacterium]
NKKIRGLVLDSVEYDWAKKFYWGNFSIEDLKGTKILGVERRGKVVVINLKGPKVPKEPEEPNGISILIHLKLTGQLIYQDKKTRVAGGHPLPPLNLPSPNKTTRATFVFTNGGHLYFNDMRKFGWVRIVESGKLKYESFLQKLGPDALEISFEDFSQRLKSKGKTRIKKLLMDQTFVSGIGNIYSDEGLWRAKIHPRRLVSSLSEGEIKALYGGIGDSLQLAIDKGGSSANSFVDTGGEKGLFLTFANAYHMTGKPCARCKTPIVREKMDGRSAHYCPSCQKMS